MPDDAYRAIQRRVISGELSSDQAVQLVIAQAQAAMGPWPRTRPRRAGDFGLKNWRDVKKHLFQDVYDRAGKERTLSLSKVDPVETWRKSRFSGGLHTKAAVFDQDNVFIGSMNFDPRSEHCNTETGLFIRSPEITREALRLLNLTTLQTVHRLRLTYSGKSRC